MVVKANRRQAVINFPGLDLSSVTERRPNAYIAIHGKQTPSGEDSETPDTSEVTLCPA